MFSSSRIHQEQIRNVAQSLKAPYLMRKADSCVSGTTTTSTQRKRPEPGSTVTIQCQRSPGLPPSPAMRCPRCSARVPEMDFLYTQKTGLCIPCWEKQEV